MSKPTYTNIEPPEILHGYMQAIGPEIEPPLQYTTTTWPEPGFQLCPKCNGEGHLKYSHEIYRVNTSSVCPVCLGKMIISRITGKPPEI